MILNTSKVGIMSIKPSHSLEEGGVLNFIATR